MKRRGFLGFMGGAVAAGPKLATSLSAEVADRSGALGFSGGFSGGEVGGIEASNPDVNRSWLMSRIDGIKKALAGESREEVINRQKNKLYAIEMRERFRLDSLRSVSPSHRHMMFVESEWKRRDMMRKMDAEYELARLERQLLGLD